MLGWTVLNQLKLDPRTRHIPVQIITLEEERQHGLSHGAFAYLVKEPTTQGLVAAFDRIKEFTTSRTRRLLIVEDNDIERQSMVGMLGHQDIEIVAAPTGTQALQLLGDQRFDCIVLDLRLPDMSGFDLLAALRDSDDLADIPVIVFTGRELSPEEDAQLHTMARSVVVKGVESPERLLDETALFLHRVVSKLPVDKQRMIERLHSSDEDLVGRTVLLVDDDPRNIFALSSVLERRGMRVLTATTGREAITAVESTPELAIVLMDIMMPEMDGYETMREIRRNALFRRLPILALTAKAMKGDREKCLAAGMDGYLTKPIRPAELDDILNIYMARQTELVTETKGLLSKKT
jgi:CheY-like chemotaxis protein